MIEYNGIVYKAGDNYGMCALERWEKSKRATQIEIFCLIDFTQEEVEELEELYFVDKQAFALLIKEYIDIMPKFGMN